MWCTKSMQSVITGLFTVMGTVVGSVVTYLLQLRSADRAERLARDQRLWQERRLAYEAFAEALIEYRPAQYDRWHQQADGPQDAAGFEARKESYRRKAAARQATLRVRLLADDPVLISCASELLRLTEDLHDAESKEDLEAGGDQAQQVLNAFIEEASAQVQNISSQPVG